MNIPTLKDQKGRDFWFKILLVACFALFVNMLYLVFQTVQPQPYVYETVVRACNAEGACNVYTTTVTTKMLSAH